MRDRAAGSGQRGDDIEGFDSEAFKTRFPILADPGPHDLDNAATAQLPDAVLAALQRFETGQRAH